MADQTPSLLYFVDPRGETVEVPADQAAIALRRGYKEATPDRVREFQTADQEAKRYGGAGQQALTGLEAAGEALTFGASDWLEKGLFDNADTIAARERQNPVSHGIGTTVGIAAPLIASLGASAPLSAGQGAGLLARGASAVARGAESVGARGLLGAAEATAPSLISRAGRSVASLVPEAAEGAGFLQRAGRTVAREGLQGATEGALFGAGNVNHEAALGDPNLTAESALTEVGLSALAGGGIGGTLGLTSVIGKTALDKAMSASRSFKNTFLERFPEMANKATGVDAGFADYVATPANRSRYANGTTLEQLEEEFYGRPTPPDAFTPEAKPTKPELERFVAGERPAKTRPEPFIAGEKPAPIVPFGPVPEGGEVGPHVEKMQSALKSQIEHTDAAVDDMFKARRTEQARRLNDEVSPMAVMDERERFASRIQGAIDDVRANPDAYPQPGGYIKTMEDIRNGMLSAADGDDPAGMYFAMNKAKQNWYSNIIKGGGEPGPQRKLISNLGWDVYRDMQKGLENEATFGTAAGMQREINAAYNQRETALKLFNKHFGSKVPSRSGRAYYEPSSKKIAAFVKRIGSADGAQADAEKALREFMDSEDALHSKIASVVEGSDAAYSPEVARSISNDTSEAILSARIRADLEENAAAFAEQKSQFKALTKEEQVAFVKTEAAREAEHSARVQARRDAYESAVEDYHFTEAERRAAIESGNEAKIAEYEAKREATLAANEKGKAEYDLKRERYGESLAQAKERAAREVRLIKGSHDVYGLIDVLGATGSYHHPILAPAFMVYRAMRALGHPSKVIKTVGMLENVASRLGGKESASVAVTARSIAPELAEKMHAIEPALSRVAFFNPALDETANVREALGILKHAKAKGVTVGELVKAGHKLGTDVEAGNEALQLAMAMESEGPRAFAARFKAWGDMAGVDARAQPLGYVPPSPEEVKAKLYEGLELPPKPPAPKAPSASAGVVESLGKKSADVQREIANRAATAVSVRGPTAAFVASSSRVEPSAAERLYDKRTAEVTALMSNPTRMQESLTGLVSGWGPMVPNTSQATQITAARAVSYLASLIPSPPQRGFFAGPWKPTQADMRRFNRAYDVIHEPSSLLKMAASGTLTAADMAAVQTVMPAIYEKMQTALAMEVSKDPQRVPLKTRQAITLMLGGTPGNIAAYQDAYVPLGPKPTPNPEKMGGKMNVANDIRTPDQQAAARGGQQ